MRTEGATTATLLSAVLADGSQPAMHTEGATTATLLFADGFQRPMHTPRIPTAPLQADGFRGPMHTDRIPTAALQADGFQRPMHTPRAPTAALQAPGIRRPLHTDRIPTASLQAERWPVAMHTLVGWSARALGVLGLFRAPTSHTVIAQLSPNHVVRPLSAAHRARATVAPMKARHLRIFSIFCKSLQKKKGLYSLDPEHA